MLRWLKELEVKSAVVAQMQAHIPANLWLRVLSPTPFPGDTDTTRGESASIAGCLAINQ